MSTNKICPECDGFKLVDADNEEGLAACPTCGGDGWIEEEDD
jgi:DnaJ-class molecular chaperone